MRLRSLYEDKKVASFALGRMNPATNGHELLVNAIEAQPGDAFLFLRLDFNSQNDVLIPEINLTKQTKQLSQ